METRQGQGWTPGPWVAPGGGPYITVAASEDVQRAYPGQTRAVVALTANHTNNVVWACGVATLEDSANARLIAAAPELVEALEAMLTLDNRDNGNQMADAITDMARAALARAKGTTD